MLSKSERETLSDWSEPGAQDPGLAKKLSAPAEPPPGRRDGWVSDTVIGIATLLSAFAVLPAPTVRRGLRRDSPDLGGSLRIS